MWKIVAGFIAFAALALFIISKGGDKVDMSGEKHGADAVHAPEAAASAPAAAGAAASAAVPSAAATAAAVPAASAPAAAPAAAAASTAK